MHSYPKVLKQTWLWLIAICGLALPSPVSAQFQFQSENAPLEIGSEGRGDIALAEGFAYVATDSGLVVCDLRDPAHLSVVTNLPSTPAYNSASFTVHMSGNRLYVPGFESLLNGITNNIGIFELEAPGKVKLLGGVRIDATPTFCTSRGNLLYATGTTNGVYILDVADPQHPRLEGHVTGIDRSIAISLQADLAYVSSYRQGLSILDISQPKQPSVEVAGIPGAAPSLDLALSDRILGLANFEGWSLYGLENRLAPRFLSQQKTFNFTSRIHLTSSQLLTLDSAGFTSFNIEDPSQPRFTGRFAPRLPVENAFTSSGFYKYQGMGVSGDQVAVTIGPWFMLFRQIPASIAPVGKLKFGGPGSSSSHAVVDASTIFVQDPGRLIGLQKIDVENPLHPTIIGRLSTTSAIPLKTLAAPAGRAVGLDATGSFVEIRATSPTNAEVIQLGGLGSGSILGMASDRDRVALVDSFNIAVFRFPPNGPPEMGRVQRSAGCSPTGMRSVAIRGDWVFADAVIFGLCPTNELIAIDFSDLKRPRMAASALCPQRIAFVSFNDGIVYAGLASGQVEVFEFTNRQLTRVGGFKAIHTAASAMTLRGVLYWGLSSGGFQIFDVRDPADIRALGGYAGVDAPTFSTDGQWLRAVSNRGDLEIFPPVEFGAPELAVQGGASGAVSLLVRGQPGETVELQQADSAFHWAKRTLLTLPTGFTSIAWNQPTDTSQFFRVIRR